MSQHIQSLLWLVASTVVTLTCHRFFISTENTEQGVQLTEEEVDPGSGPRRTDLQKVFYYHGLSTDDPEVVARDILGPEKLGNSPQSDVRK